MTAVGRTAGLMIALLWANEALASGLDPDRVRALVERGEILPLEQILKMNEGDIAGRIIEVEIEGERGALLYEIKVLRPDGRYREFKIDARTGALVRRK